MIFRANSHYLDDEKNAIIAARVTAELMRVNLANNSAIQCGF